MFGVESKVANVGRWLGLNTKRKSSPLPLHYALQAQNVYARPGGIIRRRGFRPAYDVVYDGRVTGIFAFEAPCQQLELTAVAGQKVDGMGPPGLAGDGEGGFGSDAGTNYPLYTDRFYGWCVDANGRGIEGVAIECWRLDQDPPPVVPEWTVYSDINGAWLSRATALSWWSFVPILSGYTFWPICNVGWWGYQAKNPTGYWQTGDPAAQEWWDEVQLGQNAHTFIGTPT